MRALSALTTCVSHRLTTCVNHLTVLTPCASQACPSSCRPCVHDNGAIVYLAAPKPNSSASSLTLFSPSFPISNSLLTPADSTFYIRLKSSAFSIPTLTAVQAAVISHLVHCGLLPGLPCPFLLSPLRERPSGNTDLTVSFLHCTPSNGFLRLS